MASPELLGSRPAGHPVPRWPADPLLAMSQFKQGKDPANVSLRRLIRRLVKANIPHAVLGGLAVYAHGYRRFTDDVDVLLSREDPCGLLDGLRRNDYSLVLYGVRAGQPSPAWLDYVADAGDCPLLLVPESG